MNIAVYCSSMENLPAQWQVCARTVGEWIGRHGASLVYGGVNSGLMKVVAQATKKNGGKVVGVVPARRRYDASPLNDVKVPTSDLNDRKGVMQMLGDAFVVLPGGYGTLDEFTTSFSYLNFTHQPKPIILYNPGGIYDPLLEQLRRMVDLGLMTPDKIEIIHAVPTDEQLIETLDTFYSEFLTSSQQKQ